MPYAEREIKFQETLRELLQQHKATVTHKKLGSAIGASSTTVSHYINGRIKPSFDTLVGISEFFNVTLDYLVFGERTDKPQVQDTQSVSAQMWRVMTDWRGEQGRQLDLALRVNRRLLAQVERVARELLHDRENFGPAGFLSDDEAMAIETCSAHTKVMIQTAPADLIVDASGDISTGVYFHTMVDNLRGGRSYQFVFYGRKSQHGKFADIAQAYRKLLGETDLPTDLIQGNLGFRVIEAELPIAVVIHEIDTAQLERREPVLWERFKDDGIIDGVLAYSAVRHDDALGGVVLYDGYHASALRMFKRDWDAGRLV